MATGRISKETVGRLQTSSAAAFLWDDELKGFGVRVTSSGSKTYVFQYRMGGREAKTQRYTIGRHGSPWRSEEHTSELQSLMRISYAVFCLKKKNKIKTTITTTDHYIQTNTHKT